MDILPRAQLVAIASDSAPPAVIERLRRLVADWRHSALAPAALQAGIFAWILDERPESFVLRPRPNRGGTALVTFQGRVEPMPSGSRIRGRVRLSGVARAFLLVLLLFALAAPLGALFESVPREDWHQHVLRARKILALALAILVAALVMVRLGLHLLGRHVRALLTAAARPADAADPEK